jgi:hypothetical protein
LREDETSRAGAHEQNFDTDAGVEFVKTMNSASGGFEESRFLISKVLNLVELLLLTDVTFINEFFDTVSKDLLENVFRESTVFGNTASLKVLAKQRLTTPTIKACVALINQQVLYQWLCSLNYF